MVRSFERRNWTNVRPHSFDPLDLIVSLDDVSATTRSLVTALRTEDSIRATDPEVRKWEEGVVEQVRAASSAGTTRDRFERLRRMPEEPSGSFPTIGLVDIEGWRRLTYSSTWRSLEQQEGGGNVATPTTLGRVERLTARRLVARGYLNTYVASLLLAPWDEAELALLSALPQRLDAMIGRSGKLETISEPT
jgi:hypothetical protein